MWEWECVCIISDQGHPPPPQCRDHNNIGTMDVAVSDKRHGPSSASSEVSTNIFCMFFVCALQPMKAEISDRKYASEGIVWVGIFSSDLSAFISQPGQREWSSVRISDISILWWNERESWEHGDWQPGYRIHTHPIQGPSVGVVGAAQSVYEVYILTYVYFIFMFLQRRPSLVVSSHSKR